MNVDANMDLIKEQTDARLKQILRQKPKKVIALDQLNAS